MKARHCSVCHRTGHDARRHSRRNPTGAGYKAGGVFHPNRSWSGYDPEKVHEKPKAAAAPAKKVRPAKVGTAEERTAKAKALLQERAKKHLMDEAVDQFVADGRNSSYTNRVAVIGRLRRFVAGTNNDLPRYKGITLSKDHLRKAIDRLVAFTPPEPEKKKFRIASSDRMSNTQYHAHNKPHWWIRWPSGSFYQFKSWVRGDEKLDVEVEPPEGVHSAAIGVGPNNRYGIRETVRF